ncbi:hypothetical protein RD792_015607 [Penstemon davidsonii]|uniref:Pentatricopeptide repeat-containing protein n=1 Tax=Penstemon davidsonii TaxID=160366 RepID=A0ABR0CHI5_9LAMI|nr:hypothetical protein RD792_015607 [Penstemon davidsonii]
MLLQPTTSNLRPNSHHTHIDFSSTILNSISISSGFLQNSTFYLKQPIISTTSYITHKNSVFVACSSTPQVHNNGNVQFEKRLIQNWKIIHKRISMLEDPNMDSASVLNELENEGNRLSKWELTKVVKEFRKFRRYKYALQVHEWMNDRAEKYRITTSDTAIQLDLIAKVHGISSAEQYFLSLPDKLKDKRIYGSLLNAYVRARMKEKAESLMVEIRNRGYATHALPFNVMMTLYMNLKDYEKVESLISELKKKNTPLDIYSYNIWISSNGSQGHLEKMEQVYQQMQLDTSVTPMWSTLSTMASMYIKFGEIEKAEECLKKIESGINDKDRMPYHFLISIYGSAGNKTEVYRVWNVYRANFVIVPNLGYHTVISALVRMDEIEGAEKIYDEWLSVKSHYDSRVGNLLLGWYVRKGLSETVETFFEQMVEMGGKPNPMTWEILAENHIKNRRISEALSCLQNAVSAVGSKSWKPKPMNVSSILKISEQEGNVASKDALVGVLRQLGCFEDVGYMSYIPVSIGGTFTGSVSAVEDRMVSDGEDEGGYALLGQLQESL